jgi:DNA ligase-1
MGDVAGRIRMAASITVTLGGGGGNIGGDNSNDASAAAAAATLELALHESVQASCEGLMVKVLTSPYQPDSRSSAWLKLKKDYMEGATELDLVPIGAWYGQGRKAKWYSPFLMAVYDPDTETYASVCRVMSGFSDAVYKDLFAFYNGTGEGDGDGDGDGNCEAPRTLASKPHYYETGDTPDVWLMPLQVWQLRGADFSLSRVHAAARGRVPDDRGDSLRFPRFMRLRPDLRPDQATGPEQLAALYHGQPQRVMHGGDDADDMDADDE